MAGINNGVRIRHAVIRELMTNPEFKAKYDELFRAKLLELSSSSSVAGVGTPSG